MADTNQNRVVGLFRYNADTNQMEKVATFTLTDPGRVVCEGDDALCRNLAKDGVWLKSQDATYRPSDGLSFLKALRSVFNNPYLKASWL